LALFNQREISEILKINDTAVHRDLVYLRHQAQENLQHHIHETVPSNAIENRDRNMNEATWKIVGGGILALFAFLIMWGGNRSRRPKRLNHFSDPGLYTCRISFLGYPL
jgi:hypothetical protein